MSQFGKPTGILGYLVGWIFANRTSNIRRSRWTVEQLDIPAHGRVLELGCGPGVALKACLRRFKDAAVTGVDHSAVMIAQARSRNRRAVRKKRLTLICGTLDDLPASEPPFDAIYSVNLIQFIADKPAFIAGSTKRLAKNGTLAVTFQPRGKNPARESAFAMAQSLERLLMDAGLADIRTKVLELGAVPAVCVFGCKP